MLLPKARQAKLTVRELPEETLIYDHAANKAHCLNQTASLVWKHCDGTTTVRQLAAVLQRELSVLSAEPLIHLTLEKLARRKLLETAPEVVRQDRRKLLRKLAVAALPVIMTMTAPRANAAASKPAAAAACPGGQVMCSGVCVTPKAPGVGATCSANCQCTNGNCATQLGVLTCCNANGTTCTLANPGACCSDVCVNRGGGVFTCGTPS